MSDQQKGSDIRRIIRPLPSGPVLSILSWHSMKVALWQNMPTHLQAATVRCLATLPEVEVTVVAESEIPDWRVGCGWSLPDYGQARLVVNPSYSEQEALLSRVGRFDVNIFSGIAAYPLVGRAFRRSLEVNTISGIMSEGADWRGLQGLMRMLRGRNAVRSARRQIAFVLAIGHLGEEWHDRIGFSADRIFRYGYFPEYEDPSLYPDEDVNPADVFEIVFVGQLIRRKGVDVLLRALAKVRRAPWHLTIVGDGVERHRLTNDAARLGMAKEVTFVGAIPNAEAMRIVRGADLLVLPSRWDGWGAVTNEALLRGVPVVCTDYCGSADLLAADWRGTVVRSGTIEDLRTALQRWVYRGRRTAADRRRIATWSARIRPRCSAEYILKVIRSVQHGGARPAAPWLES